MISYLYSSCLLKLKMLFITCMKQSVKRYSNSIMVKFAESSSSNNYINREKLLESIFTSIIRTLSEDIQVRVIAS